MSRSTGLVSDSHVAPDAASLRGPIPDAAGCVRLHVQTNTSRRPAVGSRLARRRCAGGPCGRPRCQAEPIEEHGSNGTARGGNPFEKAVPPRTPLSENFCDMPSGPAGGHFAQKFLEGVWGDLLFKKAPPHSIENMNVKGILFGTDELSDHTGMRRGARKEKGERR